MRYSLLDYVCCPGCSGSLACMYPSARPPESNDSVEIKEGLLSCSKCSHWFPIHGFIPELLPDHLRDWKQDLEFLNNLKSKLPPEGFKKLWEKSQEFFSQAPQTTDKGAEHKKAEISIKNKVTEPHFFQPGQSSPFNPGDPDYTIKLIRQFGNILPFLEIKQGDIVLDIAVGYAWTTEWLTKMGVEAIGVDICRTYLEIGAVRMGKQRPHLLLADIENLPLKSLTLDAVLCYNSFHHIHNRKQAMAHFYRTLKDSGNIILSEPDSTHEFMQDSKDVMRKYGILEKGMELDDVQEYCSGLNVIPPEQYHILKVRSNEQIKTLSPKFLHSHTYADCNIFVIKKRPHEEKFVSSPQRIKTKIKLKLRRLLGPLFIKIFH